MAEASKIRTFLWFDGNAEEAVNFYLSVFKDGKITTVLHYSEAGPGKPGSVLVIEFEIAGHKLGAINGGPQYKFNPAVSLAVSCETQAEIDDLWSKLTANGGFEVQCGWLTDKYGLSWQIVPAPFIKLLKTASAGQAKRMTEAMFTMKKLDIAALERAYAAK